MWFLLIFIQVLRHGFLHPAVCVRTGDCTPERYTATVCSCTTHVHETLGPCASLLLVRSIRSRIQSFGSTLPLPAPAMFCVLLLLIIIKEARW